MKICSKKEFLFFDSCYRFGNRVRVWNTFDALERDGYFGSVGIRSRQIGSNIQQTQIPYIKCFEVLRQLLARGIHWEDLYFHESPDPGGIVLQGEIQQQPGGLYLFASYAKKVMREALVDGFSLKGLAALMEIKKYFWPSSYDDLQLLFDDFSDSVVEFTAYDYSVGVIPNRNVLIWEVRDY